MTKNPSFTTYSFNLIRQKVIICYSKQLLFFVSVASGFLLKVMIVESLYHQ